MNPQEWNFVKDDKLPEYDKFVLVAWELNSRHGVTIGNRSSTNKSGHIWHILENSGKLLKTESTIIAWMDLPEYPVFKDALNVPN